MPIDRIVRVIAQRRRTYRADRTRSFRFRLRYKIGCLPIPALLFIKQSDLRFCSLVPEKLLLEVVDQATNLFDTLLDHSEVFQRRETYTQQPYPQRQLLAQELVRDLRSAQYRIRLTGNISSAFVMNRLTDCALVLSTFSGIIGETHFHKYATTISTPTAARSPCT